MNLDARLQDTVLQALEKHEQNTKSNTSPAVLWYKNK